MYFCIKITYFRNLPSTAPSMDLLPTVQHELALLETDFKTMEDAVDAACGFSLLAALTKEISSKFQLCKYV